MSSIDDNKKLAAEFLAVFSTGDVDGICALLHDDATWWVSGGVEGFSGTYSKDEMRTLLSGVTDVYVDGALRVDPVAMVAEGDRVIVEAQARGELKNGRVYEPRSVWAFDIAGGRLARIGEYLDTKHAHEVFFTP